LSVCCLELGARSGLDATRGGVAQGSVDGGGASDVDEVAPGQLGEDRSSRRSTRLAGIERAIDPGLGDPPRRAVVPGIAELGGHLGEQSPSLRFRAHRRSGPDEP
jgi:hypothetical protein